MKTTTWIALIGLLALAGIADAGTWGLCAESIRSTDLSPLARMFAGLPVVVLAVKVLVVGGVAVAVPMARELRHGSEYVLAVIPAAGALLWAYGAYTNVAYGLMR